MRIVGGARKGYCSKLRPVSVKMPSSDMRIAMTIATMGRRMKNSATAYESAFAATFVTGLTCMPGRTRCTPSTITRSPALTPAVAM